MSTQCRVRVLVVDNDPKTRNQVLRILRAAGYHAEAADGQGVELEEAAKKIAPLFRPHIVIMDLRLSDEHADDRSGLDLWQDESFSTTRCILYSAYLNIDYRISIEALRSRGVEDVIGKQERPEILLAAVEHAARKGCNCPKGLSIIWPTDWNEVAIVRSLFGEAENIPPDIVLDILRRLFPEAKSLTLKALEAKTKSFVDQARGKTILFQAWPDDKEPVVVKLAPKNQILLELAAYKEFIQDRLVGSFSAQLQQSTVFWDLGGLVYNFIGTGMKSILTYTDYYQKQTNPEALAKPLRYFFAEVWSKHYSEAKNVKQSLFRIYEARLFGTEGLKHSLGDHRSLSNTLFHLPDPVNFVLEHENESSISGTQQAIIHGDLCGDNLLTDGAHVWVIDFDRSGWGHILCDFVELEVDILTSSAVFSEEDFGVFFELVVMLMTPLSPVSIKPIGSTVPIPASIFDHIEAMKALATIVELRSLAFKIVQFHDIREYYWSILMESLGAAIRAANGFRRNQAMLIAATAADRLQHFEEDWYPAEIKWTSWRERSMRFLRRYKDETEVKYKNNPSRQLLDESIKVNFELDLREMWGVDSRG